MSGIGFGLLLSRNSKNRRKNRALSKELQNKDQIIQKLEHELHQITQTAKQLHDALEEQKRITNKLNKDNDDIFNQRDVFFSILIKYTKRDNDLCHPFTPGTPEASMQSAKNIAIEALNILKNNYPDTFKETTVEGLTNNLITKEEIPKNIQPPPPHINK